jgi:hypothetical protein
MVLKLKRSAVDARLERLHARTEQPRLQLAAAQLLLHREAVIGERVPDRDDGGVREHVDEGLRHDGDAQA